MNEQGTTKQAPKILLCGDVLGRLDLLCKRLSAVNKANGPFDAVFCVGQFFPFDIDGVKEVENYVKGEKLLPIPTYFTGNYGEGSHLLRYIGATGVDSTSIIGKVCVCNNLFWLKGSGLLKVNGLSVAYLGGKYDPLVYKDAEGAINSGAFHEDDVDALHALADDPIVVDLFLTNEWARGVSKGVVSLDAISKIDQSTRGSTIIAELVSEIKPRYHIAGSEGLFIAREPYENEGVSHVTRFVALGAVGNDGKQKFLHALSPTPSAILSPSELAVRPPNTSKSPYDSSQQGTNNVNGNKRLAHSAVILNQNTISDSHTLDGQYWRYDSAQVKKQKRGDGRDKFCFEFVAKGFCSRGASCNFKHDMGNGTPIPKGACFDFLTKGLCERGEECKFLHVLKEEANKKGVKVLTDLQPDMVYDFSNQDKCDKGADFRVSDNVDRSKQKSGKPLPNGPPESCWFCLSSPDVESHLVVSIGEHCYCTLAKGPLTEGHVLVLPVEHFPSSICVPLEVELEFEKYTHALRRYFQAQRKALVIFERFLQLRAGTHAHLQVVPIPLSKVSNLRTAFLSAAESIGFDFEILQPAETESPRHGLKRLLDGGINYFYVELPDGTMLVHPIAPREKMPMQFGREVLSTLLGVPERADWRSCALPKEKEIDIVTRFKEAFHEYDIMQLT
ncbi:hypothetical protein O6H91_14G048500 [Diphasiastrum complanatum]|uniref:Uncharacterized protein n=1 Tax=Diphasiastrum complanatum TaxID=34168 RepID=A0ACC2BP79_DIPCM|nr:hypothetical protein O6H91_14G048500 [Diphasiastrum complanatum]